MNKELKEFHYNLDRLKMDDQTWREYHEPLGEDIEGLKIAHIPVFYKMLTSHYLINYGEGSIPKLPIARMLIQYKAQDIFIKSVSSHLENLQQRQEEAMTKLLKPD